MISGNNTQLILIVVAYTFNVACEVSIRYNTVGSEELKDEFRIMNCSSM
jgi:hypothetical protein